MRKRIPFLLLLSLFVFTIGQAQLTKTVNITAGGLNGTFTPSENKTITNLKITGTLSSADLFFIRDSLSVIQVVDLSEARMISPLDSMPDRAIYKKLTLKSFIAPVNLKYIGQAAFLGCTALSEVQLPKTITELGSSAFSICGLTSIELPATITKIGGACFWNCNNLVKATVPYTNDGGDIFMGCGKLTTIVVPEGVTQIKDLAFYQLTSMTNITLPSTITSIGTQAFYNCTALDSITIPEGVTSIGDGAFWECNKMKSLSLPKSLVTIKSTGFAYCRSLTSIELPATATAIENEAFRACTGLITVTAVSGTSTYGGNIFSYCTNIKNIIIPEGTTEIKNNAFGSNFGSVTSIKIPASVKSIGDRAFYACSGIDSISIPDSVTTIGAYSFSGCTGLKSLTIPNAVTKLGVYSFQNCSNMSTVSLPTALTSIEEGVFSGCTKLASINFPNSILSLGKSAFSFCTSLVLNAIPATLTSIGESCFSGCSGLKTIVIPSSISIINNNVFYGCTGLTSVQFPNSLSSIGYQAFSECTGLTSIVIPANTTLNYSAFQNCTGLVVATAAYAYNSGSVFSGCDNLKTLLIPSGVTSIRDYAFNNCDKLDSIYIPTSVLTIGSNAFSGCRSLKKFHFPAHLMSVGDYALASCSGLTSINIPATLSTISNSCFYMCSGLVSLTLPATLKTLKSGAFQGCTGLTSITINNSFPLDLTQSTYVFYDVNKSTCQLNVPYGTSARFAVANQWSEFKNRVEKTTGIYVSSDKAELLDTPGSSTSLVIKANVAWTASSNQSWLTVSPASGTGDNTLTFTSDSTQITFIRKAIITVSAPDCITQTIEVIQKLAPKTVNILAGGLSGALTSGELNSLSTLIVNGTMDARDFKVMRDSMPQLTDLDLTGVSIVAYSGTGGTYPSFLTYSADVFPQYAFNYLNSETGKISLKTVKLPSTITGIGYYAFTGCSGLRTITIPSKVKTISNNAFYSCTGLMSITIPASINTIANYAFFNCSALTSITLNSSYPVDLSNSSNVFYNVNFTTCSLYVPYGSKSLYEAAVQWSYFTNIVENAKGFLLSTNKVKLSYDAGSSISVDLKANVTWTVSSDQTWLTVDPITGTGDGRLTLTAEANQSSVVRKALVTVSSDSIISQTIEITQNIAPKTVDIKAGGLSSALSADELNSVSILTITGTIDARDFKTMRDNMSLLTDLDLSETSILAYKGYEGTNVYDSISVANTIPVYAFFNNRTGIAKKTLKTIKIPSSVSAIGNYAFQNCNALTSFTFPNAVTTIGTYAFFNCTGLTSIYVNSTFPIDLSKTWSTFYNVNQANCILYVPYKAKTLYAAANQWSSFTNIIENTQGFLIGSDKLKLFYEQGTTGTIDISANVNWTVTTDQSWL
ncbi:MAG: leucine-rich repeat protein, partial [Paludibacter sp.]